MLNRRAALAAGVAFLAAPRATSSQAHTTVRMSVSASGQGNVVILYAIRSGIFERNGLDVQLQTASSGSAIAAAVVGGSVDIGKSNALALISAHDRGVPFVLEAPSSFYSSAAAPTVLVVAKNSPIQTARDLNGKTIAVAALGDLDTVANDAWLDQNGGDSRAVRFLELARSVTADAVASGRADAATMTSPTLQQALAGGKVRILSHPYDAIAKHFISTFYFCTSAYAKSNAETLVAFRRSLMQAIPYVNSHPAEMVPMIARFTGMDEKVVASMPHEELSTALDLKLVQPVIDAAAKYKKISKAFDARDLIDPAALG